MLLNTFYSSPVKYEEDFSVADHVYDRAFYALSAPCDCASAISSLAYALFSTVITVLHCNQSAHQKKWCVRAWEDCRFQAEMFFETLHGVINPIDAYRGKHVTFQETVKPAVASRPIAYSLIEHVSLRVLIVAQMITRLTTFINELVKCAIAYSLYFLCPEIWSKGIWHLGECSQAGAAIQLHALNTLFDGLVDVEKYRIPNSL